MKDLQKRQKMRAILYSVPSVIFLAIITVLLIKGATGMILKARETGEHARELREEAQTMILREQELRKNLARLETDSGVKDEIRERFRVVEEGEFVAVIVEDRVNASLTEDPDESWFGRLWGTIKGLWNGH